MQISLSFKDVILVRGEWDTLVEGSTGVNFFIFYEKKLKTQEPIFSQICKTKICWYESMRPVLQ